MARTVVLWSAKNRDEREEHERAITGVLTADERRNLAAALRRIADAQGLAPGVHPGFGRLGRRARERS